MAEAEAAVRVGRALRAAALAGKEVAVRGPFLVGLDPTSDRFWGSVAAPADGIDVAAVDEEALAALRAVFAARGRALRLEFVPAIAPGLDERLVALGLAMEHRVPLLGCAPQEAVAVPAPAGVTLERLGPGSDPAVVRLALETSASAFTGAGEVTDDDVARITTARRPRVLVLARLDGAPVGAGIALAPEDGVTELAGIGVVRGGRGRGVGTALTAGLAREAFAAGAAYATLSPGDDGAQRIYERCGFRALTEMVFLRDPQDQAA